MTITSKATLPKSGKKAPRKSSSLPAETVEYLKAWMMSPEHIAHPYPTEPEKAQIMADTGIELKQLTNWFVNNRKRYWKPRVEARLQQQARAAAAAAQAHAAAVAVATASVHNNPVSPEAGYKPTLPMPPGNGFVTFDLGSPSVTSGATSSSKLTSRYTHLVETDLARVMADQTANAHHDDEHVVSETSSSGSVTNSEEGNISDATTYQDEETEASYNKSTPSDELHQYEQPDDDTKDQQQQQQQPQDYSSEQTTGESSSSASIESTSALVSLAEESMDLIKKRAFAAAPTVTEPPRKRFRRISIELWRESCQKAVHVYDDALPSLEEATQLFGYQQKSN